MAGIKSTYQGVGFYESPEMWMSSWLDELWPQIPDKHNDSIYSDLAAWMQIDSAGNKFSQAKNFTIHQADPEKKNAPKEVELGCKNLLNFYFTSACHSADSSGDWWACPADGFRGSEKLCFLLCNCHIKKEQGRKWTEAITIGNLLLISHSELMLLTQWPLQ